MEWNVTHEIRSGGSRDIRNKHIPKGKTQQHDIVEDQPDPHTKKHRHVRSVQCLTRQWPKRFLNGYGKGKRARAEQTVGHKPTRTGLPAPARAKSLKRREGELVMFPRRRYALRPHRIRRFVYGQLGIDAPEQVSLFFFRVSFWRIKIFKVYIRSNFLFIYFIYPIEQLRHKISLHT